MAVGVVGAFAPGGFPDSFPEGDWKDAFGEGIFWDDSVVLDGWP